MMPVILKISYYIRCSSPTMHSDGSIEGFEVSSNLSLCRRNTASNKQLNPISPSLSLSLYPSLSSLINFIAVNK